MRRPTLLGWAVILSPVAFAAGWYLSALGMHRKIMPGVGEICHCYTGLRQKGARLLGRFPCLRVEGIIIRRIDRPGVPLCVEIEGIQLSPDEANAFFFRDGFRGVGYTGPLRLQAVEYPAIELAAEFWEERPETFEGVLIHWEFRN